MEFLLRCSLSSLVRYQVEHSKRSSITPRTHVLFPILVTISLSSSSQLLAKAIKQYVQTYSPTDGYRVVFLHHLLCKHRSQGSNGWLFRMAGLQKKKRKQRISLTTTGHCSDFKIELLTRARRRICTKKLLEVIRNTFHLRCQIFLRTYACTEDVVAHF